MNERFDISEEPIDETDMPDDPECPDPEPEDRYDPDEEE